MKKQLLYTLMLLFAIFMGGGKSLGQTVTIWEEDWTGAESGKTPSQLTSSYSGVTYSQSDNNTKIYATNQDKYAGGNVPELLIKPNTTFTVQITDLKGCKGTLSLIYKTNKTFLKVTANSEVVCQTSTDTSKGGENNITFDISDATSLTLVFENTDTKNNLRLDDIKLEGSTSGKVKDQTATTFGESIDNTTIVVNQGEESSFTAPTATLTPATAGTLTYSSSNEAVATVNATTGAITFGTEFGTTDITASYAGNDDYTASEAKYTISYKQDPGGAIVFEKNKGAFNKLSSYSSSNTTLSNATLVDINGDEHTGYQTTGGCTAKSNGCLQLQKTTGMLTSPEFTEFANGYTVTVTYYTAGQTHITITSGNLTSTGASNGDNGTQTDGTGFSATLKTKDGSAFEVKAGNACYISRIEIVPNKAPSVITLDESAANTITATTGATVNLVRTLGNTYWNTFCVPFSISAEQVAEVFGEGTVITTFSGSVTDATMNFDAAESIEAGKAYLIKPANLTENPVFEGVDIVEGEPEATTSTDGYGFRGVYSPTAMKTDGTELFISKTGTLVVPAENTNTINGMRAIVIVPEGTSGAKLNIMGNITGIDSVDGAAQTKAAAVYNLSGQRVAAGTAGLPKGVYIVNGKKTVIK